MVPVSCSDFTVLASRFPGQVLRHEFRRRAPLGHVGMNCNWRLRGTWAETSTGPNGGYAERIPTATKAMQMGIATGAKDRYGPRIPKGANAAYREELQWTQTCHMGVNSNGHEARYAGGNCNGCQGECGHEFQWAPTRHRGGNCKCQR